MRLRIWAAVLTASETEIHEGMSFYHGAHGLCRAFAKIYGSTSRQAAGIYAALSPMNGWETNVGNMLDVLRDGDAARVNTSETNRLKAVRIAHGEEPLDVLRGNKVRAFFRGIADPEDREPIPVDRHLICLALGNKLGKNELSRAASDRRLYAKVEEVYAALGRREGIGNRLASIAWFVQRRVERGNHGQIALASSVSESRAYCCGVPSWGHGKLAYRCPKCGKTRRRQPAYASPRDGFRVSDILLDDPKAVIAPDSKIFPVGRKQRPAITLPLGSAYANSARWQYLARLVVMLATGERLHRDEHVHHTNGNVMDCRRENLEVWLAEAHGRLHARSQLLYMVRDRVSGQWQRSEVPGYAEQYAVQLSAAQEFALDNPDVPF